MKILMMIVVVTTAIVYHNVRLQQMEERAAVRILDMLNNEAKDVTPDTVDPDTGVQYYSPVKYARKLAFMDCEELIYNHYQLWR